jgi:hypothetical protein
LRFFDGNDPASALPYEVPCHVMPVALVKAVLTIVQLMGSTVKEIGLDASKVTAPLTDIM